jgi:hypothetical protein
MSATRAVGNVVLRPGEAFNSVKVFSATMFADRAQLGEKVTAWIADHPRAEVKEMVVTQSSDASFHCVTIVMFYSATAA